MATLTAHASSDDPAGWRRVREEVRSHLQSNTGDAPLADRVAGVVWELLTNLRHVGGGESFTVVVEAEPHRVVVRVPGQRYDSVQRAGQPGARGLDTAARRLELAAWEWSYRYVDGANEICLEDAR